MVQGHRQGRLAADFYHSSEIMHLSDEAIVSRKETWTTVTVPVCKVIGLQSCGSRKR
jgi:hypothetical protein